MRPPGHLLPPASALGLIPQKLPRVTPVHDCTLQGEQPQHRDHACTGPKGTAGQSSFMVWGHRAHRMPREGTGIMAQPIRFCSLRGRGQAPSHPDKTSQGHREAQPSPPTGNSSVSVLPPHVFLPPAVGRVRTHTFPALLHPQHRLGLNFWPAEPPRCWQTSRDPVGQPRRWCLAASWPWHRANLALDPG